VQKQRTLTRNFSLQQAKRFLACRIALNSLFRIDAKIYGSEKMRFETASGAAPLSGMNGYASENTVFLLGA